MNSLTFDTLRGFAIGTWLGLGILPLLNVKPTVGNFVLTTVFTSLYIGAVALNYLKTQKFKL